jgi:hypothetical protein
MKPNQSQIEPPSQPGQAKIPLYIPPSRQIKPNEAKSSQMKPNQAKPKPHEAKQMPNEAKTKPNQKPNQAK